MLSAHAWKGENRQVSVGVKQEGCEEVKDKGNRRERKEEKQEQLHLFRGE